MPAPGMVCLASCSWPFCCISQCTTPAPTPTPLNNSICLLCNKKRRTLNMELEVAWQWRRAEWLHRIQWIDGWQAGRHQKQLTALCGWMVVVMNRATSQSRRLVLLRCAFSAFIILAIQATRHKKCIRIILCSSHTLSPLLHFTATVMINRRVGG